MKQEEFLTKVAKVKNEEDALELVSMIYPTSVDSSEAFYHQSAIDGMNWDSFYKVREMEEKFGIGCFSSAYIATVLAFPKISMYYSEIQNAVHQEKSDFCGRVLDMVATELIPKWDKQKNDNFFAYMLPNILTVRNAILAEDSGPSKYLRQKKGLSLVSMEAMRERSEAGNSWDTPDLDKNTEEEAFQRIKNDKMSLFRRIVGMKGEDTPASPENIWNAIVCQKLFHGAKEEDLEMLEDPEITESLLAYYEKQDREEEMALG